MNWIHRLFAAYFTKKTLPYWCILAIDCLCVLVSSLVVYTLNNGLLHTLGIFWPLLGTLCVHLPFFMVGFRLFHTYAGIIRYSTFVDLQRVACATLLGTVLIGIFDWLLGKPETLVDVRFNDLMLASLLSILLMWTIRVLVKYMFDVARSDKHQERVFIYGVRNGGMSLAKSIYNQTEPKYSLVGFVSDCDDVVDHTLMGVKVYPNDENLVQSMIGLKVSALFVSPLKSELLRENERLVNELTDAGIKIFMMPAAQEWDSKSDLLHTQLKEVDIEDLLPRNKIEIDMEAVGRLLTGKSILITGAAGSIGSEMVRQISVYKPSRLILVDQAETPLHDVRLMMAKRWPELEAHTVIGDISNPMRMESLFAAYRPDYVFHAAAYKHVPMMEDNPSESIQNNVEGTRIIADLAVKYGTKKFVMISTDKAVNPTNVMGCSKRICEMYVQSLDKAIKEGRVEGVTQFVTTRFGNVLGSNGSVIPLFKEQIKNGGPVTVTHPDIIRYFMLISEACKLVLEAGTMGNGGEIFVFDMGRAVKIVDLAKRMIRLSGARNVEIKFTGLRDGEKLYEEVLNDEEITVPTYHPKIKIAKVREYDYEDVNRSIDEMVKGSYTEDAMQIVKRMKDLVPEFKSQNSIYQTLDK